MIMKNYLYKIACTLVAFTLCSHLSYASLDSAWQALLQNKYSEAKTEFQKDLQTKEEQALQGLFISAWAEGDSPNMAKFLSGLISKYPDSPYLPAYLAFCGNANLQGWSSIEKAKGIEIALTKSKNPFLQEISNFKLSEIRDMLLDPMIERSSRDAGLLLDQWSVIGPFGKTGFGDFFESFGPEIRFATTYPGWQKEVRWNNYALVDRAGMLEFDSLIYPVQGIVYAANVVECSSETKSLLTVYSPSNVRVWWNGEPVLQKNQIFLDTAKTISIPVTLKAGKNLLLIKSDRANTWWMRASLQSVGDEKAAFKSIPFVPEEFNNVFLRPFDSTMTKSQESTGLCSEYPLSLPDASGSLSLRVFQSLLLAEWHQDRAEFDAVRDSLQAIIKSAPKFSLPYSLFGDAAMRFASIRTGSKARFQREAEQSFQKALELDPHSRIALIGLQTYYLERDQTDQALDGFDKHLKQYPDLLSSGYTGMMDYSHGLLYARKNFVGEAVACFKKSLDGFLPSFKIYEHLFTHYESNQDTVHAFAIAKEALSFFPAYLPFLKMGNRLSWDQAQKLEIHDWLEKSVNIHPFSLRYALAMGEYYAHFGKWEEARGWYGKMRDKFPDYPQLLENQAQSSFLLSDREEALRLYRKAFELNPGDTQVFKVLRDVAGRSGFPYLKYDVSLKDLDIEKAQKWQQSRASGIFLLDIMVLDLKEDGTSDQYVHQAIQILNQEGIDKWSEIVIPSGGNVEIIKARTITPDGTEWAVSNMQNLNNQQSLSMYGLEPGAIVEYAYLLHTGRTDPGLNYNYGGYFFGSDDDPMMVSQITIVRPKNLPFHCDAQPKSFLPLVSEDDGKIIACWRKDMQDGQKRTEAFSPSLSERVPSIEWSTCRDWLPFVEQYRSVQWGYEEKSEVIDNLVAQLKQKSKSSLEYVRNVYDWIRVNIEEGSGGSTTADTLILKAVECIINCGWLIIS